MRTVEKLDIQKEVITVDNQLNCLEYYINEQDKWQNFALDEIKKAYYYIYRYIDSNKNERFFAIQNKDVYDIILQISKDKLESDLLIERQKGIDAGFRMGYNSGVSKEKERIKKLSLFNRLFKKF